MESSIIYGGRGQLMEIRRIMPQYGDKSNPKCYSCGKFGHITAKCPEPKNTSAPAKNIQCYSCGKFGHISKYCKALQYNKSGI
ncbi:Gag-Pol polyprotein [Leucoagaricus sp. SymC.cos]|nr:Gag-Pol polyprotein [Leucoagaricus sp. SymC.cos]